MLYDVQVLTRFRRCLKNEIFASFEIKFRIADIFYEWKINLVRVLEKYVILLATITLKYSCLEKINNDGFFHIFDQIKVSRVPV